MQGHRILGLLGDGTMWLQATLQASNCLLHMLILGSAQMDLCWTATNLQEGRKTSGTIKARRAFQSPGTRLFPALGRSLSPREAQIHTGHWCRFGTSDSRVLLEFLPWCYHIRKTVGLTASRAAGLPVHPSQGPAAAVHDLRRSG